MCNFETCVPLLYFNPHKPSYPSLAWDLQVTDGFPAEMVSNAGLDFWNKMIFLWHWTHMGSSPHYDRIICGSWYYKPYYTALRVGNRWCYIGMVQILFEPAETNRCYQWYTGIISKNVIRSASGISTWPNIPILFTLYTTPLCAIARKYQPTFHFNADDTQLYTSFRLNNSESLHQAISNIQNSGKWISRPHCWFTKP